MSQNIVVVAHGKSEVVMWQNMKMRLKLNLHIYSEKGGEETISISHLPGLFTDGALSSEKSIIREFGNELNIANRRNERLPGLKIFTVMDIDGNNRDRKAYMSGDLLRNMPLSDKIVPIYNDDNLDQVMEQMGYRIDTGRPKASSYAEITRKIEPLEFYDRLIANPNTNMD